MESPIKYDRNSEKWFFVIGRRKSQGFHGKTMAAKAYIDALIISYPKYKVLFVGKKWSEIFKIVGVDV